MTFPLWASISSFKNRIKILTSQDCHEVKWGLSLAKCLAVYALLKYSFQSHGDTICRHSAWHPVYGPAWVQILTGKMDILKVIPSVMEDGKRGLGVTGAQSWEGLGEGSLHTRKFLPGSVGNLLTITIILYICTIYKIFSGQIAYVLLSIVHWSE